MAMPIDRAGALNVDSDGTHTQETALVTGAIVLIVLVSVAVVLRLMSRRLKKLALAADDYHVILALILSYAMFISLLFCWSPYSASSFQVNLQLIKLSKVSRMGLEDREWPMDQSQQFWQRSGSISSKLSSQLLRQLQK